MDKNNIALAIVVVLFVAGCARPVLPPAPSVGPSIDLLNCTTFPSILVFTYPKRHLNTRLASMTTRAFFTDFILPSRAILEIEQFCADEAELG